jgi:hypothetical protein
VPDDSASELETEKVMVWRGDLDDWKRCQHLMARLNRDGTKLELWKEWLGVSPRTRQRSVWTEDGYLTPTEDLGGGPIARAAALEGAQRESLVTAVREHVRPVSIHGFHNADGSQVEDLVQQFIYPESRVELFEILLAGGVTVGRDGQSPFEDFGVQFWSYTRGDDDEI